MSPGVAKFVEILVEGSTIAALGATPCLMALAYRSWSKHGRQNLPWWQSALGTISIGATFLSWFMFISFFLLGVLGFAKHLDSNVWFGLMSLTLIAGISLALALSPCSKRSGARRNTFCRPANDPSPVDHR